MFVRKALGGVGAFILLATATLAGLQPATANAAAQTWGGASGIDLNWSDTANWSPAGTAGGGTLTFNSTGGTSTTDPTSVVDQNFTISSLTLANSGTSFNQNISIPSGATTLSVTGAGGVLFGSTAFGNSSTATGGTLSIAGSGALVVNNAAANFVVGPGSSVTSTTFYDQAVYMGRLADFSFSGGSFNVGANAGGTVRSNGGTLQLAASSSITATSIVDVGDNGAATNAGHASVLFLGGTNTIHTNTLFVGHSKANGTLIFGSTGAAPQIVTIRGASGGNSRVTTFDIGDHSQSTANNVNGKVDFSSGQLNAMIGTLTIGAASNNGSTGTGTGSFIVGANPNNLVDVTTVSMAVSTTSNRATGTLTIEGGTFAFGSIGYSPNNTATVLVQGGTICSNGASSTASPQIHLGLSSNTATVTFGQAVGYTGSMTFTGPVTLDGNTTLQVNVPTTLAGTVSDGVNGATTLTMAGPGLLVISGSANLYSGGTVVNGGTLQAGNTNVLGNIFAVGTTVNGGVLDLHGNNQSVSSFTLNSGSVVNSGTAASLTVTSAPNFVLNGGTVSAALSGASTALSMTATTGTGFVLLSGSNSYGGGTTVSAGTLQLGNPSALGSSSGGLQVTGGLVDLGGQAVTTGGLTGSGGTITSTSNGGVLVLTPTLPATFSGTIAGKAGLTLNAPGSSQTLNAANSYSGPTTVSAGTLSLLAPGTLGSGVTTVSPSATLDVSAYGGGYNFSVGTLAAGPTPPGGSDINGSLNVTGAALSVTGGTNSTMTINGNLSLNGGTVSSDQGSTVALTGGGALSLLGTDVIAPNLQLNNGTYTLFTYSNLAAGGIADLKMGGPFGTSPRQIFTFHTSGGTAITLTVAGVIGNLQWNGGTNQTWDAGTSKSWYNLSTSAADFFFGGDNVTFNDTPGTATTVHIIGNVAPGALTVANTNVAYTFSGTGSIVGGTSLIMTGPGALTINTNNSYLGGTSLGGGLLSLGNSGALGSGLLTISGGSLDNSSGAAMTLAGNIAQNWNSSFGFRGSSPLNLGTGTVTLGTSATVTVSGTGALTVGGAISDGGNNYALTVAGPGALVLAGSNSYGGGTILNSGLLVVNNNSALSGGSLTINGGSLDSTAAGVTLVNNSPQSWNADIAFLGTQSLSLGAGAVTLGSSRTVTVAANTLTVGGAISDNGGGYSLTKAGPGTLNLGSQNAYGGDTLIAQGTLQLGTTGVIPTGNVDFTNAANTAVLDLDGNDTTVNELSQPTRSTTNLVVNNGLGTNTITVGNNDVSSFFAGILEDNIGSGGALALSKIGAGMLTLGGTNAYSGNTSISAGTLNLLTGSPLPAATTLNFSGTTVVSLNANTQTLANMTFADNTLTTIAGTTGSSLTCSPANLAFVPATASATFLTVNLASVGAFTYNNPTGTVQLNPVANGNTPTAVSVTLSSGTDAITAANLNVGTVSTANTIPSNTLYLGASSTLAVNTINIGIGAKRAEGAIEFAAGLLNPVLTITGASGGTSAATLNIGNHDSSHLTDIANDTLDTTLGTLYAQLGAVTIGVDSTTRGTVRGMTINSSLKMGSGSLSASSMTLGVITSGGSAGEIYNMADSGSFTLTGGTADVTTITLATNSYVFDVSTTSTNTLSGEVTLNGGAHLYASTIQAGTIAPVSSGTLNVTSQINLNNGTIGNLSGGSLDVSCATIVVSGTGEQDAFFISTGQTGAVSALISGSGAVASIGPGTLILSGTNDTFTGGLYVPNGTVILTNNEAVADGESLTVGNPLSFAPIVPAASSAAVAVPEPAALALISAALSAFVVCRRCRTRSSSVQRDAFMAATAAVPLIAIR
jgi:autotransporter-associated beta strand protein